MNYAAVGSVLAVLVMIIGGPLLAHDLIERYAFEKVFLLRR